MSRNGIAVPGGELDPSITSADVYLEPPTSGVPDYPAARVAKQYIDNLHNERYAELAALFTEDAIFLNPMRKPVKGGAEFRAFYEKIVGPQKLGIIGVSYIGSGNECMVELAIKVNIHGKEHYILSSIDHFTVNAEAK